MIVNWICLHSLRALKHAIACKLLLADVFQDLISHVCELVCVFNAVVLLQGSSTLFRLRSPWWIERKSREPFYILYNLV